jgi:DNA-binding MarR family transcriptional regulator
MLSLAASSLGGTVARSSAVKKSSQLKTEEQPHKLQALDGAQGEHLELDRLIHERMRLGIVSALAANESLSFNELKHLMNTTDGNLSIHTRKLEDAKYIACTKSFIGRRPNTQYRLTQPGRRALQKYLDHMEALIRATRDTLDR